MILSPNFWFKKKETGIPLYEKKKKPNFKTSLTMVLPLAFPTIYNPTKTNVQYQKLIAKYISAVPITKRRKRALYGVAVTKDDLKKVRAGITLNFNKHNDGKTKSVRKLMAMHRARMLATIVEALEAKQSMQINLRVETT